jgi:4-carboxymuconolactone decarboxylase
MPYYFNLALDNEVKPREISEIITHLAFYSGWANATSAVAVAKDVFANRKIGADQLPPASAALLPLDKDAEAKRAANVEQQFGKVAPGIVQYTTDILFRDLWLRPDLAPRDRSLVTFSAPIASGQVAQITYHLNRAMDKGLTQEQAGEVVTHLAFYAGWPNAFSALPVMKDVFEKRGHKYDREVTANGPYRLCVDQFASLQCRKGFNGFSCFLVGEPQLVKALQIQPKLSAGAKEMSQTQRGVTCNRTCSIQDLSNPICGHIELSGEFRRTHIECFEFFRKVFARVNCGDRHVDAPSDSQRSLR